MLWRGIGGTWNGSREGAGYIWAYAMTKGRNACMAYTAQDLRLTLSPILRDISRLKADLDITIAAIKETRTA
jgi:hypothetical protein